MLDLFETFYKLTADPFRLSPDHRFVLDHRSYAKSKSYLEYALHRGEGFIVITGGAGTGKTTLINEILEKLNKTQIQVATLSSTQLESRDLLHMVAASFGFPIKEMDKAALLLGLEDFLKEQGQKRRHAVLIVDEAQGLSSGALEELRLLANLQFNNRLLLQVFLIGQEPLRELIAKPGMDHLRQRIVAASHLEPLKLNETVDYVEHRLSRVGWQGDPKIDAEALMLIHSFSGGIPRRINMICSRLFLYGAMEKKHALVGADAKRVIGDLKQEQFVDPVAERVNGTTGGPSLVRVLAEDGVKPSIDGLPREKKTTEDSAEIATDSTQHIDAGAGVAGQRKIEGGESRSVPHSFSAKDISSEIEAFKRELKDSCEDLEGSATIDDVALQPEKKSVADAAQPAMRVTPASDKLPETDNPPEMPAPLDARLKPVEFRQTPQSRVNNKGRRRGVGMVTAIIFGLLTVGFVLVVVVGTDGIDNIFTTVSEKFVGEKIGSIQRGALDTEKPVDQVQVFPANTESFKEPPKIIDTPLQASILDEPVAPDSKPRHSLGEADPEPTEPGLSGPEGQLIAAGEDVASRQTESVPPRPSNEAELPAVSKMPGAVAGVATVSGSGASLLATKKAVEVTPFQAPPVPANIAADTVSIETKEGELPSIEAQRARLRIEAEKRLNQRLSMRRPPVEKETAKVAPLAAEKPSVMVRPEALAPLDSSKKVLRSLPKLSGQKEAKAAPTVVATAPRVKSGASISSTDRTKSALLAGHWTSRGKPATLLPSEITHCQKEGTGIVCWSVPQNVDTKHGLAVYKVEATLQSFSAAGEFRLSYRTLVRLAGDNSSENDDWQVTKHSMTCQMTQLSKILCQDEKGIKREYRQS